MLEERHDLQAVSELFAQAGMGAQEQQRVPAQIEEIVVEADLADLEQLRPQRGDAALQIGGRFRRGRNRVAPRRRRPLPGRRGELREKRCERRVCRGGKRAQERRQVFEHRLCRGRARAVPVVQEAHAELGRRFDRERDRIVRGLGRRDEVDLDVAAKTSRAFLDHVVLEDDQAVEQT
jgi:hypothetical protein